MLIRDLIRLKEVRSIIQLGRQEDQHEVLQCFIWTDDIRLLLEDFAQRLLRSEGGGIFLKGHYGTGKSHLLSWLQEQANRRWPDLFSPEAFQIPPVYANTAISLIHYPSHRSLESIVDEALGLSPEQCALLRPQRYGQWIEQELKQEKGGWLILFDELSEFLKSKPDPASLAEDLRYLQFLAEFGREKPLWVIGAIQEDIEGIGSADRETSLKLKDRFHLRWNLSNLHVEAILSARLIERTEIANDFLGRFFLRCQELWPLTFKDMGSFLAVYPLHPSTLDFLMGLGPLFSEHRGALRFAQDLLTGRWKPRSTPCLERESHELLGPELLFDYFLNRFNENLELREYYSKAWVHLENRCREILDPRDHELALRMIKILLLATVDPRREGLGLDELQGMLMHQVSGKSDLGRIYLAEQVIGRLTGRVNYLVEKDGRFLIDLHHQSQELLQRLLENRLAGLRLDQTATWGSLVMLLDTRPLELRTLWSQPEQIGDIHWLNTPRKLSIGFGEHCLDADLRITLPGQIPQNYPDHRLTWVPRLPTREEEKLLLEASAILNFVEVAPQTNTEQQAKAEAIKRKKSEAGLWRSTLESLFKEGKWFLGKNPFHPQLEWHTSFSFETFLEVPSYELFSDRHPLFRSIAPKIPYFTDRSYIDLIENFVIPSEVQESQLKSLHLEDALKGLAIPLGIVQKVRQNYRFLWEPLQSPIVEAFCKTLNQYSELPTCQRSLAEGPWGLPSNTFNFLVWAAVASGHMQALREGEVLAAGKISLHNIESIDHLEPMSCLEDRLIQNLLEDHFFTQADQSYSGLSLQRQLWAFTRQQLQNAPRWLQQWDDLQLDGAWSFALPQLLEHRETISTFHNIVESYEHQAQQGLMALHEHRHQLRHLSEALNWAKDFNRCIQKYSEELTDLWIQLFDEFLDSLPKNDSWLARREDRRALLAEYNSWQEQTKGFEQLEAWIAQVRHWLCEYREIYSESHNLAMTKTQSSDELTWLSECQKSGISTPIVSGNSCSRRPELELINKPYCRCGYIPDDTDSHTPQSLNYNETIRQLQLHYSTHALCTKLISTVENQAWQEATELLRKIKSQSQVPKSKKVSWNQLRKQLPQEPLTRQQLLARIEQCLGEEGEALFTIED